MQDLSSLAPDWGDQLTGGTSMAGGNTISSSGAKVSMVAPGSEPVDPLPNDGIKSDDPSMSFSTELSGPTSLNKGTDSIATASSWGKAGE